MTQGKMLSVAAWIAFWTFLVSGSETVLKCNVSQDSSGWTYRISDEDKKLTDLCKVQWINTTRHVIATEKDQAGPELNTLKDPRCLGNLTLKATCKENGYAADYIAYCTDICSKLAHLHEDTGGLTALWIVLGIVAVAVAVGVGFLLRKKKKERVATCTYQPVKKVNNPKPSDVEAGNV